MDYLNQQIFNPAPKPGFGNFLTTLIPIISSLNYPLVREDYLLFKQLLLLNGSQYVLMYGVALVRCLIFFLIKDPTYLVQIVKSVTRFWPKTFPTKQIYFISSFTQYFPYLSKLQGQTYYFVIQQMCALISQCVNNLNLNVCECAFSLWQHGGFTSLFFKNPQFMFPLLIPAIYEASKTHWSYAVKTHALSLLRNLKEINEIEYNTVIANCSNKNDEDIQNEKNAKRNAIWIQLSQSSLNLEETKQLAIQMEPLPSSGRSTPSLRTEVKKVPVKSQVNMFVPLPVLQRKVFNNNGDKSPVPCLPKAFASQYRLKSLSRPIMSALFVKN